MPELPEVETVRRGVEPHLVGKTIDKMLVREPRLRWPVAADLPDRLAGQTVRGVRRRAKYLLVDVADGTLIIHLGMSGRLYLVEAGKAPARHDHIDWQLDSGRVLRYTDPRRFGAVLWQPADPFAHPLLSSLGPEPLSAEFGGDYLFQRSRGRTAPVKAFLMDSRIVVGVGNIYANEALFLAGIRPSTAAGRIAKARWARLAQAVKQVLGEAIAQGGTTLRDFVGGDGKPGYFKQALRVYSRAGLPCLQCQTVLKESRLGQRSTVYCSRCQR